MEFVLLEINKVDLLTGVVGALIVALITWSLTKAIHYFTQKPRIIIQYNEHPEMNYEDAISHFGVVDRDGTFDKKKSKVRYKQVYHFKITIHNHSKYDAYYPIFGVMNHPKHYHIDDLDSNSVILANSKVVLNGSYSFTYDRKPEQRYHNILKPIEIENVWFMMKYQNDKRKNFYTVYRNGLSEIVNFKPIS